MRKLSWFKSRRPGPSGWSAAGAMLFLFALGILAGAVVGTLFPASVPAAGPGDGLSAAALPATLPLALWNSVRFFLVLLLAASSWLGVALVPAAVLLRGYLLGCSVSALYAAFAWRGLLCAFLVSGLPALVMVPCLIVAACDALGASRWLLERRFGPWAGMPARRGSLRRAGVIALLVVLEALYGFYLLPLLLADFLP